MRRTAFLNLSVGAAVAARLRPALRIPASSLDDAYLFLDDMMDLYAKGSTTRLVQSFVPTKTLNLGDVAYTYDTDLIVIALLQRGTGDDLSRATVLGDSLLYAQAHDPIGDGRIRSGYHVDPFVRKNGSIRIAFSDGDGGTDAGNMAWTGLALAHLYASTYAAAYLGGAVAIGNWIQAHCYDTRGAGGYTAGLSQHEKPLPYKATEHNVDLYALFTMLGTLTGDSAWSQRAAWARQVVEAMWNASGAFFWTGTTADGVTINRSFIPEDCQSWSYLALEEGAHAASIDWAYANLAATDGPFSGVSFSNADRSGVWFEGTAHMAAALTLRNATGDPAKSRAFLQTIALAQTRAPNEDGLGIDAASKDGLRTGDGDRYYAALHIGATSWYCIALQAGNPLRLAEG